MFEFVDEKYIVASLLIELDVFTFESLREKLRVDQLPLAALAVIDDLLTHNYIEIAEGETLVFNTKTNDFDTKPIVAYEVIPDKREAFREYIEELNKQRFQPDAQGKPQGPHYRVVEQLLEGIAVHPETLQRQETALTAYFELAQQEEVVEQNDSRQRAVSEAYIRMLYGKFLEIKSLWEDALLQLLTSSHLFGMYELEELQLVTEQQACKILKNQYEQVQKSDNENQLEAFVHSLSKVENTVPHDEKQLDVFFSLVKLTLKEIQAIREKNQVAPTPIKLSAISATLIQSQLDQQLQRSVYYADKQFDHIEQHVRNYTMKNVGIRKSRDYVYKLKREQSLLSAIEKAHHDTPGLHNTARESFRKIRNFFSL